MLHAVVMRQRQKRVRYLFEKGIKEDDGLDGFAQAHLICQDGVGALRPGKPKPVEALQLVQMQRAARRCDEVRLLLVLYCRLEQQNEQVT